MYGPYWKEQAETNAYVRRSRAQQTVSEGIVDRKIDLIVKELRRYRVSVGAIQETKWFGSDVCEAEGYLFLHSGCLLPREGESAGRNEGVGITLDESTTKACKVAGEVWSAVSSHIVTARLKVTSAGQRKPAGSRATKSIYITVVSVYAPTAKATKSIYITVVSVYAPTAKATKSIYITVVSVYAPTAKAPPSRQPKHPPADSQSTPQ